MPSNSSCENITELDPGLSPLTSTSMFTAGVVGNLLALAILHQAKPSVFRVLATALVLTDLLGTCLLSPPVFISYATGTALLGLVEGGHLCGLFAFALTFFCLASTLILGAMAVERCLAISHPYFYSQHGGRGLAKRALVTIYALALAFCSMPALGLGRHRQYCPGTWCFVEMEGVGEGEERRRTLGFSLCYATLTALLITLVLVCNASVFLSLCHMQLGSAGRREEETDHLLLLASMTFIFIVCSLPLTICVFLNAIRPLGNDLANLVAFRFYALNPILDPWIFIIFRKTVFLHIKSLFCWRFTRGRSDTHCGTSVRK